MAAPIPWFAPVTSTLRGSLTHPPSYLAGSRTHDGHGAVVVSTKPTVADVKGT